MLLQTFCFYGDFIETLSFGYAEKTEPWRRSGGEERKGKRFPSDHVN